MSFGAGLVALAFVALGCGRVAFDPTDDGGTTGGGADGATDDVFVAPASPPVFEQRAQVQPSTAIGNAVLGSVSAGNLIVVAIDVGSPSPDLTSLTDSQGNQYTIEESPGPWRVFMAHAIASATGPLTVTAVTSAFASIYNVRAFEYSSTATINPVSEFAGMVGTDIGPDAARAPVMTVEANQLIFAFITFSAAAGAGGTGYMVRSTLDGDIVQDRVEPTAGSYEVLASPAIGTGQWMVRTFAIRGR